MNETTGESQQPERTVGESTPDLPTAPAAQTPAPSTAGPQPTAAQPTAVQPTSVLPSDTRAEVPHNLGAQRPAPQPAPAPMAPVASERAQPMQVPPVISSSGESAVPPAQPGGDGTVGGGTNGGGGDAFGQVDPLPSIEPRSSKRASGLFAGLAIGALVGAIAGGATAAIVADNRGGVLPGGGGSQQITITNPEASTQVSAIAQVATPSTVTIDVASSEGSGTGSGVIYSKDGYIITNAHVVTIQGSSFTETQVRVMLSDGRMLPGTIVGTDPYADIAVIKVEATDLTPIKVAEDELAVGDLTVAIGAPFNLSNTVTSGVVSTLNRGITVGSPLIPRDEKQELNPDEENPYEFRFDAPGKGRSSGGQVTLPVIQTDASINPGNSGGPLLNSAGELIGINVAIASAGQQENQAGSVGLGFAIPVTLASRVADSIIDGEAPTHGLLGATVLDSRSSAEATQRGGLVQDVLKDSAAQKAGIRSGDVITSVDGVATGDGTSVSAMIRYFEGGAEVDITFVRDGKTLTEKVTLGTMKP